MPITVKNEGQDTLADALNAPNAYNPNAAQEAENKRNSMREYGAAHPDAPPPPLMYPAFPDNNHDEKAWRASINTLWEVQPEIKQFDAQIGEKYAEIRNNVPGISNTDAVSLAVGLVRKEKGLPLHGEKPQSNIRLVQNAADDRDPQALNAEMARLNAEAEKTRSFVGTRFDQSFMSAVRETTARGKRR